MHTLEHLLFLLSERILSETGNQELADAAKEFAGASHLYELYGPDHLVEMNARWTRLYGPFPELDSSEKEDR